MVAQLIDAGKTAFIRFLLKTSFEKQIEDRNLQFNENIITAALVNPEPCITEGPDGFPYLHLCLAAEGETAELYSIASLKDNLLHKGLGVVIHVETGEKVFAFRYGDILNLHINQELISRVDCTEQHKALVLEKQAIFFTGQPAEEYLPSIARKAISDFLISRGNPNPKVALIGSEIEGNIIYELVFNIHSEHFAKREEFEKIIDQLKWFLPRHYRIICVPDQPQFTNEMMNL